MRESRLTISTFSEAAVRNEEASARMLQAFSHEGVHRYEPRVQRADAPVSLEDPRRKPLLTSSCGDRSLLGLAAPTAGPHGLEDLYPPPEGEVPPAAAVVAVFVLEPGRPFVRKCLQLRSIDTQLSPIHWRTRSNLEATARTTVARKSSNDKHILGSGPEGKRDRARFSK